MNDIPTTGFLREKQILGSRKANIAPLIPVCKTVWWAGVKSGRFPKPLSIGPRTTVWKAEDIRQLIDRMAAEGAAQRETKLQRAA